MSKITEGAKAPDFAMDSAAGPLRLADFAGKTFVLYFYPKDDTPGCTNESKDFTALKPEFDKAGVAVVGASKDSLKSHEKFASKYGLTIPLGSDPEGKTIEAFESWVEKKLYGREYMGIDRSTFLIKDGVIQRIWRKVKVAGHAQAVLDAAKAP
ncbi:peroxiredoxin [Phenylobacterium sp.]|jgi:thioredoxin-dependent peroxiredoxin|uniref:peroxiredoxin n=1 Tax=Phenylobacterium sp. TaxID=1871053 RepID=UPI00121816E9|nr:peroxiredoxin [Phenylobacterium sp.]THD66905.1 MAG: peroxiredoxin [Phenylobacterium sp.]